MNTRILEGEMKVRFRVAIIASCPTYFWSDLPDGGKFDVNLGRTVEAAVVHPDVDTFKTQFEIGPKRLGSRHGWKDAFGVRGVDLVAFLGTRDEMQRFYETINIKALNGARFNTLSTACAHTACLATEPGAYSAINSVDQTWRGTAVLVRSESFNRSAHKLQVELPFVKEFTSLCVWDADEVMADVLSRR